MVAIKPARRSPMRGKESTKTNKKSNYRTRAGAGSRTSRQRMVSVRLACTRLVHSDSFCSAILSQSSVVVSRPKNWATRWASMRYERSGPEHGIRGMRQYRELVKDSPTQTQGADK